MQGEDKRDDLIDYYSRMFAKQDLKFTMMGMLLDRGLVDRRREENNLTDIYIFGTGPLGVQSLRALEDKVNIVGFIDEDREYYYNYNYAWGYKDIDIPVYTPEEVKKRYKGEKILLASFEDLEDMKGVCEHFAEDKDVIFINEFLFGGANSDLYK